MKRKCILYESSELYNRHVYLDAENSEELMAFIEDKKTGKKFDYIVKRILEQNFIYYEDYKKLANYDHVSEMRFFPNGINARVYCKEISREDGNYYIVAVKLLPKKSSQKIDKALDQFIKPIEQFDYEF